MAVMTGGITSPTIRRLLICYPNLAELCEGSIDESSSPEELTEHILYYYDGNESTLHYSTEDVLKFMGLCTALYTFPSSFEDDDRTEQVYCGKSIVVFCPLENNEILAVAQISHGCPLAVRNSLVKSHAIFCLLREGGIIPRLSFLRGDLLSDDESFKLKNADESDSSIQLTALDKSNNSVTEGSSVEEPMPMGMSCDALDLSYLPQESEKVDRLGDSWKQDGCVYVGMKTLYKLRKKIRKQKLALGKVSDLLEMKRKSMEENLEVMIEEVERLSKILPICSIRRDLKDHYDEFLVESSLCNRCVVEMVPRPLHPDGYIPNKPRPAATIQLGHAIRDFLKRELRSFETEESKLIGISTFYCGDLLFTHMMKSEDDEEKEVEVSNETAANIVRYMDYFQQQMQQQGIIRLPTRMPTSNSEERRNSAKKRQVYRDSNDTEKQIDNNDFQNDDSIDQQSCTETDVTPISIGQYLESPPLSMLNVSDELLEVNDAKVGNVWTPLFFLNFGDNKHVPTKVALFSINQYNFLVYLDGADYDESDDTKSKHSSIRSMQSTVSFHGNYFFSGDMMPPTYATISEAYFADEGQSPITNVLRDVSLILSQCINECIPAERTPCYSSNVERGVDIVFLDRLQQKAIVLPNPEAPSKDTSRRRSTTGSSPGVGKNDRESLILNDNTLSTDYRQLLLSRLPNNIANAFDDMMSEIDIRKRNKCDEGIELCTYLSYGWLWATVHNQQELYVLFELTECMTVTEMQRRTDKIRRKFFRTH